MFKAGFLATVFVCFLTACSRGNRARTTDAAERVAVYPLAVGDKASEQLTLTVNGAAVPILAHTALYDYAHFSSSGLATITLTAKQPIKAWSVSPLARSIAGKVSGDTLTFELPVSAYIIVKIDDLREVAIARDKVETDTPAATGRGIYNITEAPYRADASGRELATSAIQHAIDDAHAAGGGVVYVPSGLFTSASLMLRSHVSLYLAGGATLRSSGDPAQFKTYYRKDSLKMDGTWFIHTEANSENIRIFGRGTLDGNARELRGKNHYLNNLVVPLQTSRFTIEGVVLRDSGLWGLIPTRSDHVVIRDTKHFNEVDEFFENDAVDIIECQDVLVSHTIAISEDDTFSTKTWFEETDIAANWPGRPEELRNVVLVDCVAWSRCATFKVGFGSFQPQRNIIFRNSTAYRSMRAVALNRLWGSAPVENVTFENIDVEGFQPRDRDREKCRWLDINTTSDGPVVNTLLKNITVRDIGYRPSRIEGHSATARIEGLRFENVVVAGKSATSLTELDVGVTNDFVTDVSFGGKNKEVAR